MKIKKCVICKGEPMDGLPYCEKNECIVGYIDLVRKYGLEYIKKEIINK